MPCSVTHIILIAAVDNSIIKFRCFAQAYTCVTEQGIVSNSLVMTRKCRNIYEYRLYKKTVVLCTFMR